MPQDTPFPDDLTAYYESLANTPIADIAGAPPDYDREAEVADELRKSERAAKQRARTDSKKPGYEPPAIATRGEPVRAPYVPPVMEVAPGVVGFPITFWRGVDGMAGYDAAEAAFEAHLRRLNKPTSALLANGCHAVIDPYGCVVALHVKGVLMPIVNVGPRVKLIRDALHASFGPGWILQVLAQA